jgi:hypothetical protein
MEIQPPKLNYFTGVGEKERKPPHTEILTVDSVHQKALENEFAHSSVHVMESKILIMGTSRMLDPTLFLS